MARVFCLFLMILAFLVGANTTAQTGVASARPEGSCDVYAAAGTPCVAAHSTTRALYAGYHGALYRVLRQSDRKEMDVNVVEPARNGIADGGGYADALAQDAFCRNTIYWFANWIGNVAIPIAAVGYFSYFFPILSEPLVRCIAVLALVWALSFANMIGPAFVTRVQTVTTSFALVPILGIAIFGWFFFDADIFKGAYNVSGESNFGAISSAAALTLWAFIGVESASVTAGVVENPEKNVARATLAGVFLAAIAYIASSSVIMGMVPNAELQLSDAPFALAAAKAVGGWGGALVSLCAFVGAAGSLGGWILLTAQSAKAASDDGLFPSIFSKTNKDDVPVKGVLIVAVLMTLAVLVTSTSETASAQFDVITSAAVVLTLLPYIYSCVACYFVVERSHTLVHTGAFWTLTSLTVVYCLWAIYGSSGSIVQYAFLFVLFITVFYPFFSEERRQQRERAREASAIGAGAQRS